MNDNSSLITVHTAMVKGAQLTIICRLTSYRKQNGYSLLLLRRPSVQHYGKNRVKGGQEL